MKDHKPLSSKAPPKPGEDHAPIADWIANAKPALNPVVAKLDKMIRHQLDDPRYANKWGKAYYGSPDLGWCIEVVAYDVSVNVVFLNGSRLDSPPELGDETRYVKLRTLEDLEAPQLGKWIEQACSTPGWAW